MDLLLPLFALATIGGLGAALAAGGTASSRSILLLAVRHAEKGPGADPALTEKGHERARALAALLGETALTAIFSTEYRRCRETVTPLAEERGLEISVIEACDPHGLLATLRHLKPGSAAVVCGHANTIPTLITALGGEVPGLLGGMIPESTYDRVYAVTLPAGTEAGAEEATQVHTLRYGERS